MRGYGLVKKKIDDNQYYYHQNEHGDITHLTNTDSEVENSYQYDVFGNIREQQENVENVFKYAGEQLDSETQQYYLRARFYNPAIARFTQEDVYRGDGLNLYVYVVNNPLLWIDPSGFMGVRSPSDATAYLLIDGKEETIQKLEQGNTEGILVNKDKVSKFFAVLKDIENNRKAIRTSHEYGVKGIWYKDGKPDFGPVALFEVNIDNMSSERRNTKKNGVSITGNYEQTRDKLRELIYKDENTIRTIRELEFLNALPKNQTSYARKQAEEYLTKLANVPKSEFNTYFKNTVMNGEVYTVHEVKIPTSQVVPYYINKRYAHEGGVSQAKQSQSKTTCKK